MEFKGNIRNDGVQDMVPQSMAPWHTENCELKKFEKKEEARRSFCPSPTLLP